MFTKEELGLIIGLIKTELMELQDLITDGETSNKDELLAAKAKYEAILDKCNSLK